MNVNKEGTIAKVATGGWMNVGVGLLGIVAVLLVLAVLTGRRIPLLSSDRAVFIALLVVGMAMCALGPLRNIQPDAWLRPMNVVAMVLGGLALLLGLVVLTGIRVPWIASDRSALVLLAIVILSKVLLSGVHHLWLDRLAR